MQVHKTDIEGCLLLAPQCFADDRGYFIERFNEKIFADATGIDIRFVQDNESLSNYGVVRGLHMQVGTMAQAKLVHVVDGAVLDVVVDLRPDSVSYLKHIVVELSTENKHHLYIPIGCAHGFAVLRNHTIFQYKCSALYSKAHEAGINPFDETLAIAWTIPATDIITSEKDRALPTLADYLTQMAM
jgi:dTDP-4-dehydrorhamnose 3,5-epimerase